MSQLFASGGQSIGVSGSASVLPMNTQDCSDGLLGWTGLISLQSKGLSRVFSNITVQKHQFSVLSFLNSPTLTSIPSDTTIFCYLVYLKYQFINHIFFFFFFGGNIKLSSYKFRGHLEQLSGNASPWRKDSNMFMLRSIL